MYIRRTSLLCVISARVYTVFTARFFSRRLFEAAKAAGESSAEGECQELDLIISRLIFHFAASPSSQKQQPRVTHSLLPSRGQQHTHMRKSSSRSSK